jgi:predicted acetyltransferase
MPELIAPTTRLHTAWLEARREWGPGLHEDGFGLTLGDEVDSPEGFAAWVARLSASDSRAGEQAEGDAGHESGPDGAADKSAKVQRDHRAPCIYRWIVEDGRVLGAIVLRLGPAELVERLGHIGYGVRPSARRRGLATWALGRMLDEARGLGLDRVLIVCEAANTASAKTIERQGGVLDDIRETQIGAVRRYWIGLR